MRGIDAPGACAAYTRARFAAGLAVVLTRRDWAAWLGEAYERGPELEPLENLTTRRLDCAAVHVHVLVYFERDDPGQDQKDQGPGRTAGYRILGGVIFEFFTAVNCGLITYLLVGKAARGKGASPPLPDSPWIVPARD